jgi:hypothetical protein
VEDRERKLVVLVLTATLALPPPLHAQDGRATGRVTLNGASADLAHGYASARPGFFDRNAEDIRVLLSDQPLGEKARTDVFELIGLARQGKVTAIEVFIDATGQVVSGAFFARAFEGMISAAGVHRFVERERSRTRLAGRLWMERPSTFAGVTFQYEVTFDAAIPRPPTPEELAAELASAPGRLAASHVQAIVRGDFDAFVATLSEAAAASYRTGDGLARFESLRRETPADSHVVRVVGAGPARATATIEGSRGSIAIEFTLDLSSDTGTWRVVRVVD